MEKELWAQASTDQLEVNDQLLCYVQILTHRDVALAQ